MRKESDYEKLYQAVTSNPIAKKMIQKIKNSVPPYCEHNFCILPLEHNTVHLSEIMHEDEFGFKWRIYWTDTNWGSYIVDEANQVLDFWKAEIECHYKWVKENINISNKNKKT